MEKTKKIHATRIGGALLTVYLCALIPMLSFYMPDGYHDLGNAKFAAYRALSVPFAAALAICAAAVRGKRRFLFADAAALLYGAALTASFVLSVDRGESLWGTTGWRMGFLTELLFLAFWFFSRLFPIRLQAVAVVFGLSAAAVLLIAVADSFGIRFLPFMGADPAFVSTIGNVDWYGAYLALALSFAAGLWLSLTEACDGMRTARGKLRWLFSSALLFLAMLSLAAQNTESRIPVMLAGAALVFFLTAEKTAADRALRGAAGAFLALLGIAPVLIVSLYSAPWAAGRPFGEALPFGLLTDGFGNSRGAIWRITWALWRKLPLYRKLFGVGPDAYAAYVYASPDIRRLAETVFGAARLTNAHSEWFTVLVDEGAFAAVSGAAFMLSALLTLFRRVRERRSALTLTAIFAIVTVGVTQAVNFRTVTATPLLFVLIGAALRETDDVFDSAADASERKRRKV